MDQHWSRDVFRAFKSGNIRTVATVPDGGLTELLNLCEADSGITVITLSSEQEGMGLLFGLWLGGERAVLLMQSSGTGNCMNALSLPAITQTPCLMLVTMRGENGEQNPWQVPMGQGCRPALEAMGVTCFSAADNADVGTAFESAAQLAFEDGKSTAVLVHQHIIGTKEFVK